MLNTIAKLISAVLNPFVVIMIMSFALTFSFQWIILTLAVLSILAIVIHFLVKKKVFSDFDVSIQKQRPLLYLLEFVSGLIYLFIIYFLHAPKELLLGTVIIILELIVLGIVNKFIKASGHIAILSAIVTLFVFAYGWFYLLGFLLVGILAWSRLTLERHSLKEVIVGLLIGILLTVLVIVI